MHHWKRWFKLNYRILIAIIFVFTILYCGQSILQYLHKSKAKVPPTKQQPRKRPVFNQLL